MARLRKLLLFFYYSNSNLVRYFYRRLYYAVLDHFFSKPFLGNRYGFQTLGSLFCFFFLDGFRGPVTLHFHSVANLLVVELGQIFPHADEVVPAADFKINNELSYQNRVLLRLVLLAVSIAIANIRDASS